MWGWAERGEWRGGWRGEAQEWWVVRRVVRWSGEELGEVRSRKPWRRLEVR